MRHLRCIEKYVHLESEPPKVIVSVTLYEDAKLRWVRLLTFSLTAPIDEIVHNLAASYQADSIDYQQMFVWPF